MIERADIVIDEKCSDQDPERTGRHNGAPH